jgi:hypothetical protein
MIFRSIFGLRAALWTMAKAEKSRLNYQDIMTAWFLGTVTKLMSHSSKKHLAYRVVLVSIRLKVVFS